MTIRVGILLSHPTQYHSPWFRALANRPEIEIKVFYCFQPDAGAQGEGFDVAFQWDVPLLGGYPHAWLKNIARRPGFHFSGCDTPEVADIIAGREFDLWIVNGWKVKSDWQAMRACWKHNVPILVRGDSHLLDRKPLSKRIAKRMILGRWIPRFSRYLTVGKLNEDYYRFYGADPSRFFPVRHFVDNELFATQAATIDAGSMKAKWGIPESSTVFLFAGKFVEKKRPMDAICALEKVSARRADGHLLMVGDGQLRQACEQYAKEKRLPVTFTGFLNQSEIAQAYACADVLVLPSAQMETWGLVVNEAMACGLPAIVSDRVGCGPDLVTSGHTGTIFPPGDVEALSAAMLVYAENPSLISEHGRHAREQIRSYSATAAADGTVAAVLSAMKTLTASVAA